MTGFVVLAYGWGWGWAWWWWWIAIVIIFWLLLLPPFGWGRTWYANRYGGGAYGAAAPDEFAAIESQFVQSPPAALANADRLVGALLQQRRVDGLTKEYEAAHEVTLRSRSGEVDETQMRAALAQYRSIYDRLTVP